MDRNMFTSVYFAFRRPYSHMKGFTITFALLFLFSVALQAQANSTWVVDHPKWIYKSAGAIVLEKIELTSKYTIAYWSYKNTAFDTTFIEACSTFWIGSGGQRVATLVKTEGIPLRKMERGGFDCADPISAKRIPPGKAVSFKLYFTPIPSGLRRINLIEYDGMQECEFDVFGIELANKQPLLAAKEPVKPVPPKPAPKPVEKPAPKPVEKPAPKPKPVPVDTARVIVAQPSVPAKTKLKPAHTLEGAPFNNMIVLLDVSASMDDPDKLALLKSSIVKLSDLLRPEDDISILTFADEGKVILPITSGKQKENIPKVVDKIKTGGRTNAGEGIKFALATAYKQFKSKGNNRIIFATDGEFTYPKTLPDEIAKYASYGIRLTILQFGGKPSEALRILSEKGKGHYYQVDQDNADDILVDEARMGK